MVSSEIPYRPDLCIPSVQETDKPFLIIQHDSSTSGHLFPMIATTLVGVV